MTWYLQSRPDRPLHLAIWVINEDRPLCGTVADEWRYTSPLAEKWRPRAVCKHCVSELVKLNVAVATAGERR